MLVGTCVLSLDSSEFIAVQKAWRLGLWSNVIFVGFVAILYGCNFTTNFSFQRIIECLMRMLKLSQFFIRLVKSLKFVGNSLKSAFNARTKD